MFAYPLEQTELVDPPSWPPPFSIEQVGFLFPSSLAPRISSQRGLFSVHPRPDVMARKSDTDRQKSRQIAEAVRNIELSETDAWGISTCFPQER